MEETARLSHKLGNILLRQGLFITTAESCTGGGVAEAITETAGCSRWFNCAFVTYSDTAKQKMLGVNPALIVKNGAVSKAVVRAMAEGARKKAEADLAISVSGIAGPGGAVEGKPVGTVWIAWAWGNQIEALEHHFKGDRAAVRNQSVCAALEGALERLS